MHAAEVGDGHCVSQATPFGCSLMAVMVVEMPSSRCRWERHVHGARYTTAQTLRSTQCALRAACYCRRHTDRTFYEPAAQAFLLLTFVLVVSIHKFYNFAFCFARLSRNPYVSRSGRLVILPAGLCWTGSIFGLGERQERLGCQIESGRTDHCVGVG